MSQLDWPGGNHFQQTLQCVTVNSIFDLNLSPESKSSEERKTEHHQVSKGILRSNSFNYDSLIWTHQSLLQNKISLVYIKQEISLSFKFLNLGST